LIAKYAITAMALLAACPTSAIERISCVLNTSCSGETICAPKTSELHFGIDPNQFVAPIDAKEPPRNKVTIVSMDGESFRAEPIQTEFGLRGFWSAQNGTERLLTIQPDGTATYSLSSELGQLTGKCEVIS